MASNIKALTEQYRAAFDKKDLDAVASLFDDNFVLIDPKIHEIGKSNALKAVKGIFDSCKSLSFRARNMFVDGNVGIIEFELDLDAVHLKGTDIIEWSNDGKMKELRAYLDMPK